MANVPNAGLREAFTTSGISAREVAARCEWWRRDGRPDDGAVLRLLGLKPTHCYRGEDRFRHEIHETDAKLLAGALNRYPVECGF